MESNSDKKFYSSNLEKGIQLVREGNLHQADICFDAEATQADAPNSDVFVQHGHLLNRLGRYHEAIDKFDSFYNNDEDTSCLFGKGISNIGLLKLDDASSFFEKVIDIYPSHADAYFYLAIIYCYPSYEKYNLSIAKDFYKKYQKLRKDFFNNNPDYFNFLGDDLSPDNLREYYDEIHNFYKLRDSFKIINQFLEREGADNSNEYSYKQLSLLNDADEKKVDDLLKIVGYDKELMDDLSSKFELTVENKRTLNKILYSSKNYDISFRDLHDLIRVNVLDGNESIDSFYEKLGDFINNHIDKKNRKLNRLEEMNKELENEKESLTENIDSLAKENVDLNNKNKKLEEKMAELYNKLNTINADKSDNESMDKGMSVFGDDFQNATSLNMISGIDHEDYEKDLDVLASKGDIPQDDFSIFKTAIDEYDAGNFNEAYELFNKLSCNFKWPSEYMNFLIVTSKSHYNIQESYEVIHRGVSTKKAFEEKYDIDKYPIRWFNFGNIYFDYANSQSGKKATDAFKFAGYCYDNAINASKPKSNYKFNFNDKEDFIYNAQMMSKRVVISNKSSQIDKLKQEIRKLKQDIGELKHKYES